MIYFIGNPTRRAIKIGVATEVGRRLCALQIGSVDPLFLVGTAPGGMEQERHLHRRFKADRIRGEWFRWSSEIEAAAKEWSDSAAHALPDFPEPDPTSAGYMEAKRRWEGLATAKVGFDVLMAWYSEPWGSGASGRRFSFTFEYGFGPQPDGFWAWVDDRFGVELLCPTAKLATVSFLKAFDEWRGLC